MNLQLTDLKRSIVFNPFKPFNEESEDYKNMIKEYEAAYTLIDNFTIVRVKTNFYIQLNYTSAYKKSVVFPQSRTIRAILTESLGHKIE